MRAKEFLRTPLIEKGQWLKPYLDSMNDDGSWVGDPMPEFDAFAKDFIDIVIFPFPPGSTLERLTDTVISALGMVDGMKYIRLVVARYVEPAVDWIYEFNPMAKLADKLPD